MTDATRASPVVAEFDPREFEFGVESGMQTALRANRGPTDGNYIADLSALRRRLFIGRGAADWLSDHGVAASLPLYATADLGGGALLARIHRDQYLLVEAPHGDGAAILFDAATGRHDEMLIMTYEAAEFACGGPDVGKILSELCPADVAAMPGATWHATRIAHCEAAIRAIDDPLHYRITCSPADATFLFRVLWDVTATREGVMLGLDDYRASLAGE